MNRDQEPVPATRGARGPSNQKSLGVSISHRSVCSCNSKESDLTHDCFRSNSAAILSIFDGAFDRRLFQLREEADLEPSRHARANAACRPYPCGNSGL